MRDEEVPDGTPTASGKGRGKGRGRGGKGRGRGRGRQAQNPGPEPENAKPELPDGGGQQPSEQVWVSPVKKKSRRGKSAQDDNTSEPPAVSQGKRRPRLSKGGQGEKENSGHHEPASSNHRPDEPKGKKQKTPKQDAGTGWSWVWLFFMFACFTSRNSGASSS